MSETSSSSIIHVCTEPLRIQTPKDVHTRMAFMKDRGWGGGHKLTIRFLNGEPAVQHKVEAVAREWTKHADIGFAFIPSGEADIRVTFTPGGSWSLIGKDAQELDSETATMNLGWLTTDTPDDEYQRVVLHEFGHALGCLHEHQHPDAGIHWNVERVKEYYKKEFGWSDAQIEMNIFHKYDQSLLRSTDHVDRQSIMIYGIPQELLQEGEQPIEWNRQLSDLDKSFIAQLYL